MDSDECLFGFDIFGGIKANHIIGAKKGNSPPSIGMISWNSRKYSTLLKKWNNIVNEFSILGIPNFKDPLVAYKLI
jgi:hypothetical protein